MEIIAGSSDFYLREDTAVAIGKFDGVHIGHRRLLEEVLGKKASGLRACVFTFDPSPAVLFGQGDGRELTVKNEKRLFFERMGVDILIEFPLTKNTAAMEPEAFVQDVLAGLLNARFIAAGRDLSFGREGRGNGALLSELAPGLGMEVKTIEKICVDGREVSSSLVREQVEQGNMILAERLLGMPYPIVGQVVRGNQIGRTLGFPTVNVTPPPSKLLPPKGVYLSEAVCGGRRYRAVSNVGCKPTVAREQVMGVESYLYDFDREVYGETVEIYLKEFRRPERKFESTEALREQLARDIKSCK